MRNVADARVVAQEEQRHASLAYKAGRADAEASNIVLSHSAPPHAGAAYVGKEKVPHLGQLPLRRSRRPIPLLWMTVVKRIIFLSEYI